jgi:hypothetical protein
MDSSNSWPSNFMASRPFFSRTSTLTWTKAVAGAAATHRDRRDVTSALRRSKLLLSELTAVRMELFAANVITADPIQWPHELCLQTRKNSHESRD